MTDDNEDDTYQSFACVACTRVHLVNLENWKGIGRGGGLGRRADELGANILSQAPNDLVTAALSKLVGCEEQREVIGNFEAIELQPHAAVGKVFNEAGMFFALPEHDRCHASELVARCPASLLRHAAIPHVVAEPQTVAAGSLAKAPNDPLLQVG